MKRYYGYIKKAGEQTEELQTGISRKCYQDSLFALFTNQPAETAAIVEDEHAVIMVDGFVYFKNSGGKETSLNKLYQQHADDFIRHLTGEFVVIVWDKRTHALRCYRDHFGTRPFYYMENDSGFFFSNDLRTLRSISATTRFDEEWMADLFAGTVSDKHVTPYQGLRRLPPAHFLIADPGRQSRVQRFWDLDVHGKEMNISEGEATEHFRYLLEKAVRIRLSGNLAVGSELSGGLDSTVVASLANRFCKEKALDFHVFSHVMADEDLEHYFPFKDEREYISQVVDFAGIAHHHFIPPGEAAILDALEHGLKVQGAPTQQRFYEFSDLLYQRAKSQGVNLLFSGFGGDEGVSSHAGGYLQELMHHHQWKRVWNELRKKEKNTLKQLYKWLMVFGQVTFYGAYQRYGQHFGSEYSRIHEKTGQLPLHRHVLKSYEVHERAQEKSRFPNDLLVKDRQYKRIMHPHVSQRMEYSAIAAGEYGIEYRYPLWDKDLLQFYINLPTHLKRQNNTGRYIYRKSVNGLIPESIRWRNDKTGATIPSVHRRLLNDAEKIRRFIYRCDKKGIGTEFMDMKKMKNWLDDIIQRNTDQKNIYQGMFFNYLMFLKHLEWKYEGKI